LHIAQDFLIMFPMGEDRYNMNTMSLLFLIAGAAVGVFFGLFSISSIIERKLRAALIAALLLVVVGAVWFGGFFAFDPSPYVLTAAVLLIIAMGLLFFLSVGQTKTQRIDQFTERVDERDVMFARADYRPGSDQYDAYYRMRPEKKEIDDKIRGLAELLSPGGQYYDPVRSGYVASLFGLEERLVTLVDGPVSPDERQIDPKEASTILKRLTLDLGAAQVGIARLNPHWVYSQVGRGPEQWGAEIKNEHPYVIVFSVEMGYSQVQEAPLIGISEETALQYLHAQRISIVLAHYIRSLGYQARAHVSGSNYQIMLPPVAYDAGLGELGRFGYLISPRFGARIRLGAVTTGIPLVPDEPIQFGVQNFCEKCRKCAENCPPRAIPSGSKTMIRGVEKWQLDIEKCYHYWRVIGTDCGLCMKVCPFSHPDNLIHNILRAGIKRSSFARSVSLVGDDLFYGKKVKLPQAEA
jgi:reductive dehalogenase